MPQQVTGFFFVFVFEKEMHMSFLGGYPNPFGVEQLEEGGLKPHGEIV